MSTITVHVSDSLHDEIKANAARDGVSVNRFITQTLTEKLAVANLVANKSIGKASTTGMANRQVVEPWTEEKNARRCELIDKEIQEVITSAESEELCRLQEQMRQHLHRIAPLDLETPRRLHEELLAKKRRRTE